MAARLARSCRPVVFSALMVFFVAAIAPAQQPPPPPQNVPAAQSRDQGKIVEGTARLKGQVLSPTGEPIKRATVVLSGGGPNEQPRSVTTDGEGRFEFERVRSGRLSLTASKVGYVTTGIGAKKPGGAARPIDVADGAILENANIRLERGCAVSGRLLDEYGDPVTDGVPRLLKFRFAQGRRQLATVYQGERTDDLGEFRIYGVAPGDYYLAVAFRPMILSGEPATNNSGYAPTYYPGTASQAEAARIGCTVGQEVRLNDLALMTVPTVTISGTVRLSTGKPPGGPASILSLQQLGANATQGAMPVFASSQTDGSFTMADVVPGDYLLQVQISGSNEGAILPLSVTRSITGLAITTTKAGVLSGRVVPDTGLSFNIPMAQVSLGLTPLQPDARRVGFSGADRIKDDGTFEVSGLHGVFGLRTAAPGWHVKTVRLNGADVTDSGVPMAFSGDVSGLEVTLTNRVTTVSGTVQDDRQATVHDYAVLAFPEDRAKWHWNSRYQQMARPDQAGKFMFQNLAPANYLFVAVREAEPEEWTDPEFLERLRDRAARVSVTEGDAKTLQLSLATEEKR